MTPTRQCFRFAAPAGGVLPTWAARVDVDADTLGVRFGPWRLRVPRTEIADAVVTGPYTALKVFGVRLSLADRGLTFGSSTAGGVCVRFTHDRRGVDLALHPSGDRRLLHRTHHDDLGWFAAGRGHDRADRSGGDHGQDAGDQAQFHPAPSARPRGGAAGREPALSGEPAFSRGLARRRELAVEVGAAQFTAVGV